MSFLCACHVRMCAYHFDLCFQDIADSTTAITVTSIHGQKYQCSYVNKLDQQEQEKTQADEALEIGVIDLLKPIADGPCLQFVNL